MRASAVLIFACLFVASVGLAQQPAQVKPAEPPAAAPAEAAKVPVEAVQPAFAPPLVDTQEMQQLRGEALKELEHYWEAEPGEEPADGLALDVRQAVETALKQNPKVFMAQDEVDIARAQTDQAKAERLPQVGVKSAYAYVQGAESSMGILTKIIGMEVSRTFRRDELNIRQTLYAGGQIAAAVRASKFLAESQEWRKQANLNQLEFDTKQAYYNVLLARAMIKVAQESVVTFERHLADTQQMFDVGLVSQFEVLRAKTELSARQSNWVAAKNAERLALVNLRRTLALPEDQPLRLSGSLEIRPLEKSVEELLAEAEENRPELLALNKGINAAEQNVKGAKGRFLPKAAANADYITVDHGGVAQPDGWQLGVGAQWDIYAGGKRKAQVGEARARQSSLVNQREDLTRVVELDVRQAYIQMQDALAKITEERTTVVSAREGQRLAQLRFQEGVGTQAEVLDAELALSAAESSLVQALHDYAVAYSSIERATGQSWFPEMVPAETCVKK